MTISAARQQVCGVVLLECEIMLLSHFLGRPTLMEPRARLSDRIDTL